MNSVPIRQFRIAVKMVHGSNSAPSSKALLVSDCSLGKIILILYWDRFADQEFRISFRQGYLVLIMAKLRFILDIRLTGDIAGLLGRLRSGK